MLAELEEEVNIPQGIYSGTRQEAGELILEAWKILNPGNPCKLTAGRNELRCGINSHRQLQCQFKIVFNETKHLSREYKINLEKSTVKHNRKTHRKKYTRKKKISDVIPEETNNDAIDADKVFGRNDELRQLHQNQQDETLPVKKLFRNEDAFREENTPSRMVPAKSLMIGEYKDLNLFQRLLFAQNVYALLSNNKNHELLLEYNESHRANWKDLVPDCLKETSVFLKKNNETNHEYIEVRNKKHEVINAHDLKDAGQFLKFNRNLLCHSEEYGLKQSGLYVFTEMVLKNGHLRYNDAWPLLFDKRRFVLSHFFPLY